MSMERLVATCNLKGLSAVQFRVLACLANHENNITGKCNPSYATIAKETEISDRYAKMVIDSLCELKLITVEETFAKSKCHSSNSYHFSFQKISQDKICGEPQFTTPSKGSESQFTTVVKHSSPPLCTTDHHVVNHSSPKPVIESGSKPGISIRKTTTPTPPAQANASQTQASGGGGGGVVIDPFKPMYYDQVQAYLDENGVRITNPTLFRPTVTRLIANGWITSKGRTVEDWKAYVTSMATNMKPAAPSTVAVAKPVPDDGIDDEKFARIKRMLEDLPED